MTIFCREYLERYEDKAVLNKWIASSQMIDMSEGNSLAQEKLNKFYKKLVENDLPLLFHTGVESSIPAPVKGYERFNSPKYIEPVFSFQAFGNS
jgi:predicted TIM-barrel fold metal-dependent hydrolase